MVYELKIGKSKYVVHVYKNGGHTTVYRHDKELFHGQYFPDRKKLTVWKFPIQELVKTIEKSINDKLKPGDVIFPYYAEKR